MARAVAQSRMVVSMAPDCATKATVPGLAIRCAKDALSFMGVEMMPMQLGPTTRRSFGFAASRTACCRALPSALPISLNPALITMAARVPRWASSAIIPGTVAGGVQITARSGVTGRRATSG